MIRELFVAAAIALGIAGAPVVHAAPSTTSPTTGATVYYPNCAMACADGVAPIYRGQPGYRPGLDRDNDGVACEVCH